VYVARIGGGENRSVDTRIVCTLFDASGTSETTCDTSCDFPKRFGRGFFWGLAGGCSLFFILLFEEEEEVEGLGPLGDSHSSSDWFLRWLLPLPLSILRLTAVGSSPGRRMFDSEGKKN